MYPNLYYIFKDWFGVEINFLKLFNSFGFFVAIGFIVSAQVLTNELKRKEKQGLLKATINKSTSNLSSANSNRLDVVINALLGFIFGFKILGILTTPQALNNPQAYIFSSNGSWLWGFVFAGIALALKLKDAKKAKSNTTTVVESQSILPHQRVNDIVIYAAIFGFLGAKIFHNLENWNEFWANPIEGLLSFSGLTFYGGLICAALAIIRYAQKHNMNNWAFYDAFAPTMMIAYAVGRIGCQVAGDGDWGVINSAFVANANGESILASPQQFSQAYTSYQNFYTQHYGHVINHITVQPFWGLPNWLFGYTYPHNVINEGIALASCEGGTYCNYLPMPVFPTPFYETLICSAFFGILILLRNKLKTPGILFGIYLMMNGFERFMIEKIRVNTVYNISNGFKPTQAEIISAFLFILGIVVIILSKKAKKQPTEAIA